MASLIIERLDQLRRPGEGLRSEFFRRFIKGGDGLQPAPREIAIRRHLTLIGEPRERLDYALPFRGE